MVLMLNVNVKFMKTTINPLKFIPDELMTY